MAELTGSIEDRLAIADVLLAYGRALDAMDFEVLTECFTAECQAQYSTYEPFDGAAELVEFLRSRTSTTTWHQHFIQVMSIDVAPDGRSADTLAYFIAHSQRDETLVVQVGEYRDRVVRSGEDGWRIARRVQSTGAKYSPG